MSPFPLPRFAHRRECRAHEYADNDMCNCEPLNLDVDARDSWISERLPAAQAKSPLLDTGVVVARLQRDWESLQMAYANEAHIRPLRDAS